MVPLFYGLFTKIPVVVVGPNVEFLLEIADLLRGYMPDEELNVRLTITLHSQSLSHMSLLNLQSRGIFKIYIYII